MEKFQISWIYISKLIKRTCLKRKRKGSWKTRITFMPLLIFALLKFTCTFTIRVKPWSGSTCEKKTTMDKNMYAPCQLFKIMHTFHTMGNASSTPATCGKDKQDTERKGIQFYRFWHRSKYVYSLLFKIMYIFHTIGNASSTPPTPGKDEWDTQRKGIQYYRFWLS